MSGANQPEGAPAPEPPQSDSDFVRWEGDIMATGIASIDEQHRELIRQVNELHRATLSGVSLDDIRKILSFLGRYVATHFQHEEGIMEEHKCPQRMENRLAHAKFLSDYRRLQHEFSDDCDPDEVAVRIKVMTGRWLTAHICRIDVALRAEEVVDEPNADATP
jgi:hemerythrin